MRKLIVLITLALLTASLVWGAAPRVGSWSESTVQYPNGLRATTLTWAADSTGTVSADTSTVVFRGVVLQIVTKPDTSQVPAIADSSGRYPTANYDIVVTDARGANAFGTSLSNRHTSNAEVAVPKTSDGTEFPFWGDSKLIFNVSNNSIPNARGYIILYWFQY
jgi:hypothetical protein